METKSGGNNGFGFVAVLIVWGSFAYLLIQFLSGFDAGEFFASLAKNFKNELISLFR